MFNQRLPASWRKEISDNWFNHEFQLRLLENSAIYKEWLQTSQLFKTLASVWPKLPEDIRDNTVSLIEAFVHKNRPEISEILIRFYREIQDSISDKQKEQIENRLGIQQNQRTPDILTENHIENREELDLFFAKVDWTPYFGS